MKFLVWLQLKFQKNCKSNRRSKNIVWLRWTPANISQIAYLIWHRFDINHKLCKEKRFNFHFHFRRVKKHTHGGCSCCCCCMVVVSMTNRIAIKIRAAGSWAITLERGRMRTLATFHHYLSPMLAHWNESRKTHTNASHLIGFTCIHWIEFQVLSPLKNSNCDSIDCNLILWKKNPNYYSIFNSFYSNCSSYSHLCPSFF